MEKGLFIVSTGQTAVETARLAQRVLSSASSTYPQLANIRHLQVPLQPTKLQDWSAWLAVEVVDQWLDYSYMGVSVDLAMSKLGLATLENQSSVLLSTLNTGEPGVSLTAELSSRINAVRYRYSQEKGLRANWQQLLEQENIALSRWFSPPPKSASDGSARVGWERVQFNAEALQIKNQLYLKKVILSWRQAGLQTTLRFLQDFGERLTYIYTRYDRQRQIFSRKEASAWRAFNNLSAKLERQGSQGSFQTEKRQVTFDVVLQALLKTYAFKLEAEIYGQACQLVGRLRQEIHLLAFEFVQSSAFLGNIKSEFMQRSAEEPFFAPLLMQSLKQNLDSLKFRRQLEAAVNCPTYLWSSLRRPQKLMIRQQILSHLSPLCLEVYTQCYASLMSLQLTDTPFDQASSQLAATKMLDEPLQQSNPSPH